MGVADYLDEITGIEGALKVSSRYLLVASRNFFLWRCFSSVVLLLFAHSLHHALLLFLLLLLLLVLTVRGSGGSHFDWKFVAFLAHESAHR